MVGELDLSVLVVFFLFVWLFSLMRDVAEMRKKSKRKLSKYVCIVLSEGRSVWGGNRKSRV